MSNDSDVHITHGEYHTPQRSVYSWNKVAQGTYYWRVSVLLAGLEGPWSNGFQIKSVTLPTSLAGADGPLGAPSRQKKYVLPRIAWQLQRKDSTMLCLEGCDGRESSPGIARIPPVAPMEMFIAFGPP